MKIIKGDLILTEDTTFTESIKVEGNIKGYYNLKVAGNINAWDINAGNINAWDINAGNIDAGNIDARNINAWDIVCEKRIKARKEYKTICRVFVQDKSSIERREKLTGEKE